MVQAVIYIHIFSGRRFYMDRDYLEALGVGGDAAQKILSDFDCLSDRIDGLNRELDSFREIDADKLRSEAERWETLYNELQFDRAVDIALISAGAKSHVAAKALIDASEISVENGKIQGLDEQVLKLKRDYDYLFFDRSEMPALRITGASSGALNAFSPPGAANLNGALRTLFGKK